MPPKFDKSTTRTFQLFQRPENDPLSHTEDGPQGIFYETQDLNSREVKNSKKSRVVRRGQLEAMQDEFMAAGRRENEGEAAQYGITFDDSNYDYMQHLRPIGEQPDAYFLGRDGKISDSYIPREAAGRMTLQDLLNGGNAEAAPAQTFREHYQSQLPVQDALAGLQPDMDPRLREVLEALEDEEYVEQGEDDDDDLFSELLGTGEMKNESEWRQTATEESAADLVQGNDEADWEFAFRKFKLEDRQAGADGDEVGSDELDSDVGSDIGSDFGAVSDSGSESNETITKEPLNHRTGTGAGAALARSEAAESEVGDSLGQLGAPLRGASARQAQRKKKKRIGAKTDLSGYSMSSSANYRNDGLTLLDDSFDLVEEQYTQEDEPEVHEEFDMSKERGDLESIMDDFLDKYVVEGKHLVKKVK